MLEQSNIFIILGIALCALAILQMGMSVANSFGLLLLNRKQFNRSQQQLRETISEKSHQAPAQNKSNSWTGYRPFIVSKVVKETDATTSVYLQPEDRKAIPDFLPGQHLTFRFQIPGQNKPVVRCYSLSDGPGKDYYRISVKKSLPPRGTEHPPGLVSTYINTEVKSGDRVDVKSPSGHFFLDESSSNPVVLLAGGIGITPMVSMIDRIIHSGSNRLVILVYGAVHLKDQAFSQHLKGIAKAHDNIHVMSCFSKPHADDVKGVDYQVEGFASVDVLKQVLPNNACQYYICGPPPFMNSLYDGLIQWQVPEKDIFFEAFGPASIKRKSDSAAVKSDDAAPMDPVTFSDSQKTVVWNPDSNSLLDLAEANDIAIDSGCRAGSCGTCETELISGKVKYIDGANADCPPGKCLVCIARPDGPIELGA